MEILDTNKLLLLILFIMPGFISLKTYELLFPSDKNDYSKQIIEAVTYSCINYALLTLPIYFFIKVGIDNIFFKSVFIFFVLFIAPIIWVFIWKHIRLSDFFQKNIPHPTQKPWDYIFSKREPYWIIITLKNGKIIGGKYASNSFSSSSPAEEQIYLEETWNMNKNGGFERKRVNTKGILVLKNEIVSLEFFKL